MNYRMHAENLSLLVKERELPAELVPPDDFPTRIDFGDKKEQRRGDNKVGANNNEDPDSDSGSDSDSSSDSEDDRIGALSKSLVGIPRLSKSHTVVGTRGEFNATILIREGDKDAPRYRLMRYSYS